MRVMAAQFVVVVDIADADELLGQRDEAGDTLLVHRQLEIFEGRQTGLTLEMIDVLSSETRRW